MAAPDPQHVEYAEVVLFSFGIVPEEKFDAVLAGSLRHDGAAGQLKAIKEEMFLRQTAYRMSLRGRPYLVRLRIAGEVGRQKVVRTHDVVAILDTLARVADAGGPPVTTTRPPRA